MAGICNDDESTDDEIDVDLHLGERLRINRGENSKFTEDKVLETTKDFKQSYNMHRRKFALEGQSSSSSSIEVQNDNPILGLHSSDNYHNKKRQNGDKNIEQLANPKRTCLSDRFRTSPEWPLLKKKASKHDSVPETSLFPDSFYLHRGAAPSVFTDKKCEEHVNNLADAEDSDFEIPVKMNRNTKMENGQSSKSSKIQFSTSNKVKSFENTASTSYINNFLDSDSEDESKSVLQNGTLKGGRQESTADPAYYKKLMGHKVNRKVLDSDETEDENSMAVYRSRPLIFSSSDSEDFTPNITKNKHIGPASNGSSGPSHSYGDNLDESVSTSSKQFRPFRTNQKNSKRAFCSMSSNRADSSDGCDRQFLNTELHRKNLPHRTCKTRRSTKINMAPNLTSNGFPKGSNISGSARGRRVSGSERGGRRSGSPHHRSNRCQHKADEVSCRGRSASVSRTQIENPTYATRYPEVFDAEESENEFFTANSYSDTETSTESLGGLTINTNFPNHSDSLSCTINCETRLDASSDDEISVVFSTGPYGRNNETRRGTPRTLGRRHSRGTPHRQLQNAREVVSLSPDPVEQVRQVEEDERMARMLQAQFDAEMDADYVPVVPHNVSENEDSDDDDIIDPLGDTDSDEPANMSPFPFFPIHRRGFGMHRFTPNRSSVPTAIFLGNRRLDTRSRHRPLYPIASREYPDSQFERIMGLPDLAASFLNDYETLLGLDLADEVIPRGLTKSEINRLPTRKYIHPNSALSSSGSGVTHRRTELNKECQVCLTDYETGDMLRILPCFHEFHTPCIDPWLSINFTCPVCRVTVDLDA